MSLTNPRFQLQPPSSPHNYAVETLNRLQADVVSVARSLAVDEVSTTLAHQLNEPLTALLLYLHELKKTGERSADASVESSSMRQMVENALFETERVCDIMERVGQNFEASAEVDGAVARDRDAIESWSRNGSAKVNGSAPSAPLNSGLRLLTPREREVLRLITEGVSNKEGGMQLGISRRTFEVHRSHIMEKVGAKNAADLVRRALSEPTAA